MLSAIGSAQAAHGLDPERLLLGFETSDDAAVWQIDEHTAAVLTVDFFTPVVDDPYEFGRIAGANALSDVFAMGARPYVALNLLALDSALGGEVASAILRGGAAAAHEAGVLVAGGHTIDDDEPKYGLSVFGLVDPQHIVRNEGARAGDVLYLTKRLGTGIVSAALKIGVLSPEQGRAAIESMMELNAAASQAMLQADVHAATDVTGFGLAGHLHEMLSASGVAAELDFSRLPMFDQVWELSCAYCRPNRSFSIMDLAEAYVFQENLSNEEYDNRMGVLCDPQTSGGLLISLAPDKAATFEQAFQERTGRLPWRIGRIIEGVPGTIRFSDGTSAPLKTKIAG